MLPCVSFGQAKVVEHRRVLAKCLVADVRVQSATISKTYALVVPNGDDSYSLAIGALEDSSVTEMASPQMDMVDRGQSSLCRVVYKNL